jgi:hypothetical protein
MPSKSNSAHWKHEANYLHEASCIEGENELIGWVPTKSERIELQQRDDYRPPYFLKQTATQQEFTEFCEILEELWTLNNEFAGERTLEVEAYLAVTGECEVLSEMARYWCQSYFDHRKDKCNNRDNGDPLNKFIRLSNEYETLLGHFERRDKSINYVILGNCIPFIRWLLGRDALESLNKDTSPTAQSQHDKLHAFLTEYGTLQDHISSFINIICYCADPSQLAAISNESEACLKGKLSALADNVQQMRPFLIRGFDFGNTIVELGDRLFVAWDWSTNGMAQILSSPDKDILIEHYTASHKVYIPIRIRHDGLLCDGYKPWMTVATMPSIPGVNAFAVNLYLFELLHDKLFSCYDKIDFPRIRSRAKGSTEEEMAQDDELFAESCQQLAATVVESKEPDIVEDSSPKVSYRVLRSLRMMQLLGFLENRFNCEVQYGKGSEITVFRTGGKKAVLSHHKRNDAIHPNRIRMLLSRLGIPIREWIEAVYA